MMTLYDEATPAGRLATAIRLAASAHRGQLDKAGAPYILHPIRVMMMCKHVNQQIVAVLHDTVEDTDVQLTTIENLFGGIIAQAVEAMTKRTGESYMKFIARCGINSIARVVKLADIADNTSPERIAALDYDERCRLANKYAPAREYLAALR
jgi:(p)ppGpp synthase/HD superfamily hydrolase